MKIQICIPFHLKGKHNKVYKIAFRHYASLGYSVNLCGSEGEYSRKYCEEFLSDTVRYIEVPQESICTLSKGDDVLRKKFTDSLNTLDGNCDWKCLVGADDIVPKQFFEQLEKTDPTGIKMCGVSMDSPLYIIAPDQTKYRIKLNYTMKLRLLPGVNAFSRECMRNLNPYQLPGCETGAEMLIEKNGKVIPIDSYVVMVKDHNCLNQMYKILLRHESVAMSRHEKLMIDKYVPRT